MEAVTRWYLYVNAAGDELLTLITDEDFGDGDVFVCVAAGTEDACEAAARLMKIGSLEAGG